MQLRTASFIAAMLISAAGATAAENPWKSKVAAAVDAARKAPSAVRISCVILISLGVRFHD